MVMTDDALNVANDDLTSFYRHLIIWRLCVYIDSQRNWNCNSSHCFEPCVLRRTHLPLTMFFLFTNYYTYFPFWCHSIHVMWNMKNCEHWTLFPVQSCARCCEINVWIK